MADEPIEQLSEFNDRLGGGDLSVPDIDSTLAPVAVLNRQRFGSLFDA